MTRIRHLTAETLHESLPFYHAFRREIAEPYPGLFARGTGAEHYLAWWTSVLTAGLGTQLVAADDAGDVGILLATVTPDMYDGCLVAIEHAWYVMPEGRGGDAGRDLLFAFETWGRERGARKLILSHFILGMPDLEPAFARRGYVPLEKHYLRALDG